MLAFVGPPGMVREFLEDRILLYLCKVARCLSRKLASARKERVVALRRAGWLGIRLKPIVSQGTDWLCHKKFPVRSFSKILRPFASFFGMG